MAEVLDRPQFRVLTNPKTGETTGRVYFPGIYPEMDESKDRLL